MLRSKDAIVITGSCIVAHTLERQDLDSFLPGDIDVFVKQNLKLEDEIFDRTFLVSNILRPLQAEGIEWLPKDIPVKDGLHSELKKYGNCRIDIVHIIEFSVFSKDHAAIHPNIQIIVVVDDSPTPDELAPFCLTPFERKVVTSFDIDIVQGAYNPIEKSIIFAYNDTENNIRNMKFWYICDSLRPFRLKSDIERVEKYTARGFTWMGFKDIVDPDFAISLGKFVMTKPEPFEHDMGEHPFYF